MTFTLMSDGGSCAVVHTHCGVLASYTRDGIELLSEESAFSPVRFLTRDKVDCGMEFQPIYLTKSALTLELRNSWGMERFLSLRVTYAVNDDGFDAQLAVHNETDEALTWTCADGIASLAQQSVQNGEEPLKPLLTFTPWEEQPIVTAGGRITLAHGETYCEGCHALVMDA